MPIHKPSVVLGASVVAACFVALSAMQASTVPVPSHVAASFPTIQVAGIPAPHQMVQIKEGAPYVVPAGRRLVVTAIGDVAGPGTSPTLWVDGQVEMRAYIQFGPSAVSMIELPSGLALTAGSNVSVASTSGNGRAWGYVAAP